MATTSGSSVTYSPTPQKSNVNGCRGTRRLGGHGGISTLVNVTDVQSRSMYASYPLELSTNVVSQTEVKGDNAAEVTINISCVCGNDQLTCSLVIQCDQCGCWFHTDCVYLNEENIAEIEGEDLDWMCPPCISEELDNPESSIDVVSSSVSEFGQKYKFSRSDQSIHISRLERKKCRRFDQRN